MRPAAPGAIAPSRARAGTRREGTRGTSRGGSRRRGLERTGLGRRRASGDAPPTRLLGERGVSGSDDDRVGLASSQATGAASYAPGSSFLLQQAAASSNVGGPALCALNGGLNYQIEHHLFPRLHNGHYPAVAPIVKAWCKEQGYPYVHYPTVGENVRAMVRHLWRLGNVA